MNMHGTGREQSTWPALDIGTGSLHRASRHWRNYAVLTTRSPWAAANSAVTKADDVLIVEDNTRAALDSYAQRLRTHDTIVGIGSGLVMDAAKYVAKRNLQRLIQVPSTASNNACFTRTAWVMESGQRVAERECPIPGTIIVDRTLLAAAPAALNRAGVAEILCSHTALFDWKLAHESGRDVQWDDALVAVTRSELEKLDILAPAIASDDVDAFVAIIEACARFAPWFTSHPRARFNAGSEHIFAWGLDATAGRRLVHGEAVSLGILLMAQLQKNAPQRAASVILAAGVSFHPDDIGVTWDVVEKTFAELPRFSETMPWFTVINSLGASQFTSPQRDGFLSHARDYIDQLKNSHAR